MSIQTILEEIRTTRHSILRKSHLNFIMNEKLLQKGLILGKTNQFFKFRSTKTRQIHAKATRNARINRFTNQTEVGQERNGEWRQFTKTEVASGRAR